LFISTFNAQSEIKPYYTGDAVQFGGGVVAASTNMGALELFVLDGKNLTRTAVVRSFGESLVDKGNGLYDVALSEENGRLFAYAVDGRYLYKYDATDPRAPFLSGKAKDNSFDWFLGVEKSDGRIATIGKKSVKVWNNNLDIVDSYKVNNDYHYNIKFANQGRYLFNVLGDKLAIFIAETRSILATSTLEIADAHFRKTYYDTRDGLVYVVDDKALKAFNFEGDLVKSFRHISNFGYDVAGFDGGDFLYFSDGLGIVKVDRETMRAVKWVYTNKLGIDKGWAMGMNAVRAGGKEYLVVFSNSNISVLDNNLRLVAFHRSEAEMAPQEPLALATDKSGSRANSLVIVSGRGYAPRERLAIALAGQSFRAETDQNGRFVKAITVPPVLPMRSEITVKGETSGLNYSVGFEIE